MWRCALVCLQAKGNNRKILGIGPKAGRKEIRDRYRELALVVHPDKNPQKDAAHAFQLVSAAFKEVRGCDACLLLCSCDLSMSAMLTAMLCGCYVPMPPISAHAGRCNLEELQAQKIIRHMDCSCGHCCSSVDVYRVSRCLPVHKCCSIFP